MHRERGADKENYPEDNKHRARTNVSEVLLLGSPVAHPYEPRHGARKSHVDDQAYTKSES